MVILTRLEPFLVSPSPTAGLGGKLPSLPRPPFARLKMRVRVHVRAHVGVGARPALLALNDLKIGEGRGSFTTGGLLESSWGVLGWSWEVLGRFWRILCGLGVLLGRPGAVLG